MTKKWIFNAGRPIELSREQIELLKDAFRSNLPNYQACAYAKMSYANYKRWMKKGREELAEDKESEYTEFYIEINHVKTSETKDLLDNIKSGKRGWQGCAWILERTQRDDFANDTQLMKVLKTILDQQEKINKHLPEDSLNVTKEK